MVWVMIIPAPVKASIASMANKFLILFRDDFFGENKLSSSSASNAFVQSKKKKIKTSNNNDKRYILHVPFFVLHLCIKTIFWLDVADDSFCMRRQVEPAPLIFIP